MNIPSPQQGPMSGFAYQGVSFPVYNGQPQPNQFSKNGGLDFRNPKLSPNAPEPHPVQYQHTLSQPQSNTRPTYPPQPMPTNQQPNKRKPPEDLLTSPFDAAMPVESRDVVPPPIPPNPQKDALLSTLSQTLSEQVRSMHQSTISAVAPLRAQQAALGTTANAINSEMSQLKDLEVLLSSNETILHQAMRDADKVLEDAKRRTVPNVDEVLIAPTVVSRQLYELVAEQRALEDSRNVLAKALDKGRITGSLWAKVNQWLFYFLPSGAS